ncbi:Cytochrome c family protein [Bathymodiolus heckerae thiotrophic gill symbiont]|uniref:c-type cytochrome n=1 Tax=Bathymodiolus heckerae thiotrophic gill symbiont TaxID=1052212 RepID=UPI0010B3984F|nr:cytochrome c [Bathymodiolus heckerae thiotrophic gill symbiont]SMN14049.1 Cytochrome c family protein [Bathymodiolus heckerae thiotrophic gill symbiont]SMN17061.1 Cytochrome c family protein [uncultured Candidatus Thioglobus sp.]
MKSLLKILFIIGLLFLLVWFGVFNISATEKHWGITTKLLTFVKERSITVRAYDIKAPDLSKPDMIKSGAKNFDAMCAQCHLSPIKESTELSLGLYPKAPVFYQQNHTGHGLGNTFWTIKNGLKMTGMPAWGDSHTDQQIWEMVAFLEKLNDMPASEYMQLVGDGGHTHKNTKHIKKPVVPKSNNAHQEDGHSH